jgi:hypothetical protein
MVVLGVRYYRCASGTCARGAGLATALEDVLWRQYALLYEDVQQVVPTAVRWAALRQRLKRVRIGEDADEIWTRWE